MEFVMSFFSCVFMAVLGQELYRDLLEALCGDEGCRMWSQMAWVQILTLTSCAVLSTFGILWKPQFLHLIISLLLRIILRGRLPWWLRWQRICLQWGGPGFDPWVGKILRGRKWQPTPVFLPGKPHIQRSLVATDHRVAQSQTRLKQLSTHTWILRDRQGNYLISIVPGTWLILSKS